MTTYLDEAYREGQSDHQLGLRKQTWDEFQTVHGRRQTAEQTRRAYKRYIDGYNRALEGGSSS